MNNLAENLDLQTSVKLSRHWFVETLKVALNFASKQDVRYYLNGVCVHFKHNKVAIIATDGHRMFFNEAETFIPDNLKDTQYILSRDSLAQLKSMPKLNKNQIDENPNLEFEIPAPDSNFATFTDWNEAKYQFEVINGRYPDYERVIWKDAPVPTAEIGFHLPYLADLAKLKPLLPKEQQGVFALKNADSSARITARNMLSDSDILFILMPTRL